MPTPTSRGPTDRRCRWIAPSGSLGDALVLSGVLRAGHAGTGEQFGVVRCQPCSSLFIGHPAVTSIAAVDRGGTAIQPTDYWRLPFAGRCSIRPYDRLSVLLFDQVLGDGLPWAPLAEEDVARLPGLPFRLSPILVGAGVESPREEWPRDRWAKLVRRIAAETPLPIVQAGMVRQPPLPGALNVSGRLSPRLLLALVAHSQAILTVDPFLTQAGRMSSVPTVNILGPTSPAARGCADQVNVYSPAPCTISCLDAGRDDTPQPCPMSPTCLSGIGVDQVFAAFSGSILPSLEPGRALLA